MTISWLLSIIIIVFSGYGALSTRLITFGDSTMDITKCLANLLDVDMFPMSPPYSNQSRYSSYLTWQDYFIQEYYEQIEVVSYGCSGAFVQKDFIFYAFNNTKVATIPGLVSQVNQFVNHQGQNSTLGDSDLNIALIHIGANDLAEQALNPSATDINSTLYADSFKQAIILLTEAGIDQIFVGNTVELGSYSPLDKFLEDFFPALIPSLDNQYYDMYNAYNETMMSLMMEDYPITVIPIDSFHKVIKYTAEEQGVNSVDPCISPTSLLTGDYYILPECDEFHKRVWFDGVHLADWGQNAYAKIMAQFLKQEGIIS